MAQLGHNHSQHPDLTPAEAGLWDRVGVVANKATKSLELNREESGWTEVDMLLLEMTVDQPDALFSVERM